MKPLRLFLILILIVATFTVPLDSSRILVDAENRHGDPGQAGRVNFIGSNPMTAQWSLDINPAHHKRLSASNGLLTLIVSDKNSVICIETSTGKSVWDGKLTTPNSISNSPAVTDKMGVVTCNGGYIIAYDLRRGCELFRLSTGWESMSSPVIGESYILVKGTNKDKSRGGLLAISPVTGRIEWKIGCSGSSPQPPAICAGFIRIPSPISGEILTVNESNGEVVSKKMIDGEITYISTRFDVVAVTTKDSISIFNATDSTLNWFKSFEDTGEITWSPTISKNFIFLCTENGGKLFALKMENGETLWEKSLISRCYQPLVDRDRIILTLERSVEICDQKTGDELWSIDTVGTTIGNALAIRDNMLIATSVSKLISLKTAGYEIVADSDKINLGTVTMEDAYVYNSDLTVSNCSIEERHIICCSDSPWLSVSPEFFDIAGGQELNLVLSAELDGYPSNNYQTNITLSWDHGELVIPVKISKVSKMIPPPKPGFLSVNKTQLELTGALNQILESELIAITNTGGSATSFTISSKDKWILLSESAKKLLPGVTAEIGIICIPQLANHGLNSGTITLTSSTGQTIQINLEFTRNPGTEKIIIEVKADRNWIKINNVKYRSRPAPILSGENLLVPLNSIVLALDARLARWKGSPDAPCKTEFNQLIRNGITVGNCVGCDSLIISTPGGEESITIPCSSQIIDGHVMIPILPVLEAFDKDVSYRVEDGVTFFEISFPEIVD